MIRFAGATIVQPAGLLAPGTLTVEGDRIAEVREGHHASGARDLSGHIIVPGFIDLHVHGVQGVDTLEGGNAVATIASHLPRHGVTAFCPTSIACPPADLLSMFAAIRAARAKRHPLAARVLPAHLESNFISEEFKGAQPLACIRAPREIVRGHFSGADILHAIAQWRPEVGIITLAPEIDGVLDVIPTFVSQGHRVSLGHSGATYEEGLAGIAAGATHATHLFNRMTGFSHRAPGLAGAILDSDDVAAEIICDGVHVHPAAVRLAVAAKSPSRIMAITDGTGGSGLPPGSRATLGGRTITVRNAAYLDDGTLAGSVLTMERAFATLVNAMGFSLVDASLMCSTTPARELKLQGFGGITPGNQADFVVLDGDLRVVETYIDGVVAYARTPMPA